MIPTVFGVIVITFILFNVAGGSPASMTLGMHVSPKRLEEFDEQRGANKPLFFGNWTGTRAYGAESFDRSPGAWRDVNGVEHEPRAGSDPGKIVIQSGKAHTVPLAFNLHPDTSYRWIMTYRLASGSGLAARGSAVEDGGDVFPDPEDSSFPIPPSKRWRTITIPFQSGEKPMTLMLESDGAPLEISALRLERKTSHFFDSQFIYYLSQLARLDFGVSHATNQRVSRMLMDGIGPSLCLTVPIFLLGLAAAIAISLFCAFFRDTWIDRVAVVASVVLMSVNYLVWIVASQYVFAYRLRWFPIWGFESWSYLLLPVLIGVITGLGTNVRFYRTIMLDEMYRDYVRTAFAKGVGKGGVLFKHVLKNAMIPIVTNVVIAIPFLYTGSLLLETFFGIPGLGSMGINAINSSDVDVVRAIVFIGAVLYVGANLLTDIIYAIVDPRVKLQ